MRSQNKVYCMFGTSWVLDVGCFKFSKLTKAQIYLNGRSVTLY